MFKLLGLLVIAYALQAAYKGRVYAKAGPGGRHVDREESPEYFWMVIVCYLGLGVALLTIF